MQEPWWRKAVSPLTMFLASASENLMAGPVSSSAMRCPPMVLVRPRMILSSHCPWTGGRMFLLSTTLTALLTTAVMALRTCRSRMTPVVYSLEEIMSNETWLRSPPSSF
eukprot:4177272-Heterocapsa_arctica.AAC.1